MSVRSPGLAALGAVALCAAAAFAHDDDQKVLDRVPPYLGPGVRTGEPRVAGGASAAVSGMAFPKSGVTLLSWVPLSELGSPKNGNSCWGYTSASGREYALMGLSSGTAFVEISDPGDPRVVAIVPGPASLWRDMRTYQTHAYAVSEGGDGIQVIDLAQIDAGVVTLVNTVHTGGELATHTLSINTDTGYLYRAGGSGNGLRIYSLANPAAPAFVASWPDRYVHEAQSWLYTTGPYAGKEIVFACGGFNGGFSQTGVDILDVTNKQSIQLIKRFSYSGAAYSHQAWLSPDKRYLYLNDELDEQGQIPTTTKVFDVLNLSNPVQKPSFTNASIAIGHNLYTKGNLIYEANYRSGLRVFDATNPLQPVEVAWFDTWPDDDQPSFNGLWNVHPFFQSGAVIGSDLERGLFVWWVGAPLVAFDYPAGQPDPLDPGGELVRVELDELNPGDLVAGSVQLHYDAGAGFQSVPLADLGGHVFDAPLPSLPCTTLLRWYVSARSQNGFTWTSPEGAPANTWLTTSATHETTVQVEDAEQAAGWASNDIDDTATEGHWILVDPIGTATQPEDDITAAPGRLAWLTGQGSPFQTPGAHDVDGGKASLTSPALDASGLANPHVRYWRWYSNHTGTNPHQDVFRVLVSGDDGIVWHTVEVVGPAGPQTQGGWYLRQFRVADFVPPSPHVRVRFVVEDLPPDSIVDACVDQLELVDLGCPPVAPQTYCTAKTTSVGCTAAIGFSGSPSTTSPQPFLVTATQVQSSQLGLLYYGHGAVALPFQGGTLCVQPPVLRTPAQGSGGSPPPFDCSGQLAFDFNALIQSGANPQLAPGIQVNVQYWFRDPGDPFGTGLSDALEFLIGL